MHIYFFHYFVGNIRRASDLGYSLPRDTTNSQRRSYPPATSRRPNTGPTSSRNALRFDTRSYLIVTLAAEEAFYRIGEEAQQLQDHVVISVARWKGRRDLWRIGRRSRTLTPEPVLRTTGGSFAAGPNGCATVNDNPMAPTNCRARRAIQAASAEIGSVSFQPGGSLCFKYLNPIFPIFQRV